MDILTLISSEHREVGKVFDTLLRKEKTDLITQRKSFEKLYSMLAVHIEAEEKVLYSTLESRLGNKIDVLEAREEHHLARQLLRELEQMDCKDERWIPKLIVLKENIQHHVKEEEGKLFEQVRKTFKKSELANLGHEFAQKSKELYGEIEKAS